MNIKLSSNFFLLWLNEHYAFYHQMSNFKEESPVWDALLKFSIWSSTVGLFCKCHSSAKFFFMKGFPGTSAVSSLLFNLQSHIVAYRLVEEPLQSPCWWPHTLCVFTFPHSFTPELEGKALSLVKPGPLFVPIVLFHPFSSCSLRQSPLQSFFSLYPSPTCKNTKSLSCKRNALPSKQNAVIFLFHYSPSHFSKPHSTAR